MRPVFTGFILWVFPLSIKGDAQSVDLAKTGVAPTC